MKALIASVVSLLFGLAIGWYIERGRAEHEKTQIVQQTVEGSETSDRERAVRAVRAIESIQSGDTQKAVQLLSTPVAQYYTLYTESGIRDEKRAETVLSLSSSRRPIRLSPLGLPSFPAICKSGHHDPPAQQTGCRQGRDRASFCDCIP